MNARRAPLLLLLLLSGCGRSELLHDVIVPSLPPQVMEPVVVPPRCADVRTNGDVVLAPAVVEPALNFVKMISTADRLFVVNSRWEEKGSVELFELKDGCSLLRGHLDSRFPGRPSIVAAKDGSIFIAWQADEHVWTMKWDGTNFTPAGSIDVPGGIHAVQQPEFFANAVGTWLAVPFVEPNVALKISFFVRLEDTWGRRGELHGVLGMSGANGRLATSDGQQLVVWNLEQGTPPRRDVVIPCVDCQNVRLIDGEGLIDAVMQPFITPPPTLDLQALTLSTHNPTTLPLLGTDTQNAWLEVARAPDERAAVLTSECTNSRCDRLRSRLWFAGLDGWEASPRELDGASAIVLDRSKQQLVVTTRVGDELLLRWLD